MNENVNWMEQWRNGDKHWYECKKHHTCEKDYVWHLATCSCENRRYLASNIDEIICDELIDIKHINFNEKKST